MGEHSTIERLLTITRAMRTRADVEPTLEAIARSVHRDFACETATVAVADAAGTLTLRVMLGFPSEVVEARLGERIRRDELLAIFDPQCALWENAYFVCTDPAAGAERREHHDRLLLVARGVAGEVGAVLSLDGGIDPRGLDEEQKRSLQLYADLLALAVSRFGGASIERDRLTDPLTGLPNRQWLLERLEAAMKASALDDATPALIIIDIDDFTALNEGLGSPAGDRVLTAVAERLKATIAPGDFVARVGADEFAILLSRRSGNTHVVACVDAVNHALLEPLALDRPVFVTVSSGIVPEIRSYYRVEELLRDGDAALAYAKMLGGARYAIFDAQMPSKAARRLALTSDLRTAVENSQFSVAYQPIVSLTDGRIVGFEALVRWQHPESGEMMPGDFLNLAEDVGLVAGIGRFVFAEACARLEEWQAIAGRRIGIAINVTVAELMQSDLPQFMINNCERFSIDPHDVTLEITGSAMLRCSAAAIAALERLRRLGIRLAIDDFGTGYSSLRYLQQHTVDAIKIDRTFVGGADGELASASVVRTLIELGTSHGVEVVAEGIETGDQLAALRDLGCRYGQGYYFSQPMGPEWVDLALADEQDAGGR